MFALNELKECPNSLGELLRNRFFTNTGGYGCYTNFSLREDIKNKRVEERRDADDVDNDFDPEEWVCADWESPLGKITMGYYWDGDGTLEFKLPDGSVLQNTDCKKDYYWKLYMS